MIQTLISKSDDYEQVDLLELTVEEWLDSSRGHFVFETSGTTGEAKLVVHSREAIIASIQRSESTFKWENERFLCPLPIHKTGGKMMVFRALHLGYPLHLVKPCSEPLSQLPTEHEFTSMSITPHQLMHTYENCTDKYKLNRFRSVLIGGAPLNQPFRDQLLKQNDVNADKMWHTFGMSETLSHIAVHSLRQDEYGIYQVLNGVKWSCEEELLHVRDNYFDVKTQDIVQKVDSKRFRWLGRKDDVINSGGVKFSLQAVKNQILAVLKDAGIGRDIELVATEDREFGERLVLFVEGPTIADLKFVKELMKRELPAYHTPKKWVFVDELPRNESGKIDRIRLKDLV